MNKSGKRLNLAFKIMLHVTFVLFALLSTAGPILLGNSSMVNQFLGIVTEAGSGTGVEGDMYYNTKFKNMKEVREASLDIIEETMKEGAVLVKNGVVDGETGKKALPLAKDSTVNMYGAASYWSVYTGQGPAASSLTEAPWTTGSHFTTGLQMPGSR